MSAKEFRARCEQFRKEYTSEAEQSARAEGGVAHDAWKNVLNILTLYTEEFQKMEAELDAKYREEMTKALDEYAVLLALSH